VLSHEKAGGPHPLYSALYDSQRISLGAKRLRIATAVVSELAYNATSRNRRIYGVNPESVGEMTLDQGGGHGPVYYKSCTINPEYSWRWGSPLYGYQRAEGGDLTIGGYR
jgi:hypothetical protein